VKCFGWAKVGKPAFISNSEPGSELKTAKEMARIAGVSVKTIQQPKSQEAGLSEDVRDGKITASGQLISLVSLRLIAKVLWTLPLPQVKPEARSLGRDLHVAEPEEV